MEDTPVPTPAGIFATVEFKALTSHKGETCRLTRVVLCNERSEDIKDISLAAPPGLLPPPTGEGKICLPAIWFWAGVGIGAVVIAGLAVMLVRSGKWPISRTGKGPAGPSRNENKSTI